MLRLDPDAVVWSAPESARRERPLLILLHGRGADERDLASLMPALPSGFVIASVRAPFAEGPGWSWFEAGANRPGDPEPENADAAADAVLTWLREHGGLTQTVGALGFSQGGAVATHLLRRDPHRIAFAVNLAGFVARGVQAGDEVLAQSLPPVFWGRGADDPLFDYELLRRTEPWLTRHTRLMVGCYLGLGHSISDEELRDVAGFLNGRLAAEPVSARPTKMG